ncbi:hypothetical protein BW730_13730 [Tessaracoccus aquimaris]|uniref:Uncharacterized protein n=1 Tax=Tessaracoccus aquimaris TaxID=1332264 RepID=A0A1Q2CQL4_9ACTN|nr:hypothetical protein BW730_13730 [Tessaracoccus aquimaris]
MCLTALLAFLPLQTADRVDLAKADAFGASGASLTQVAVGLSSQIDARDTTAALMVTLEKHSAAVAMTRDPDAGFVFVTDRGGLFGGEYPALEPYEALVSARLSADSGFLEDLGGGGFVVVGTIPKLAEVEGVAPNVVSAAGEDSYGSGYYLFTVPRGGDIHALQEDLDQLWRAHGVDVVHEGLAPPPDRWAVLLAMRNPYTLFVWLALVGSLAALVVVGRSPSVRATRWLRIAASCGATRAAAWRRVLARYVSSAAAGSAIACGSLWGLALGIGQLSLLASPSSLLWEVLVASLGGLIIAALIGAGHAWAAVRRVDHEICW